MQVDRVKILITNSLNYNLGRGNFNGYELGLSGGIDSAVVLAMAYDAVGKENIHCMMLPYYENDNLKDAIELASNFGVSYTIKSIKKVHEAFLNIQEITQKASENLMARIRMCLIYSLANSCNRLVLGTCNLSEIMTGYFTKWGDGAADIEPLGRLLKKHVYELAFHWNNNHPDGPKIPEQIITKNPSADLYPGQTDEKEIGSYIVLDNYLMNNIYDEDYEISANDEKRIQELILLSQHKRDPIYVIHIPENFITERKTRLTPSETVKILKGSLLNTTADQMQDLVRSLMSMVTDE